MDRKVAIFAAAALFAGIATAQAAPANTGAAAQDASHRAQLQKVQFTFEFGARPDYRYRDRERRRWYLRHGYVWDGRDWVRPYGYYRYRNPYRGYYDDYYDR